MSTARALHVTVDTEQFKPTAVLGRVARAGAAVAPVAPPVSPSAGAYGVPPDWQQPAPMPAPASPSGGAYGVPPEWQQQGGSYLDYLRMMDPPPLPEEDDDLIAAIMAQSPLAGGGY